jgi:hypothetical protein
LKRSILKFIGFFIMRQDYLNLHLLEVSDNGILEQDLDEN